MLKEFLIKHLDDNAKKQCFNRFAEIKGYPELKLNMQEIDFSAKAKLN